MTPFFFEPANHQKTNPAGDFAQLPGEFFLQVFCGTAGGADGFLSIVGGSQGMVGHVRGRNRMPHAPDNSNFGGVFKFARQSKDGNRGKSRLADRGGAFFPLLTDFQGMINSRIRNVHEPHTMAGANQGPLHQQAMLAEGKSSAAMLPYKRTVTHINPILFYNH